MYINSCFARNPQRDGVRSQRLTAVPAVLSNKKRKLKKIKVEKGFLCVSVPLWLNFKRGVRCQINPEN